MVTKHARMRKVGTSFNIKLYCGIEKQLGSTYILNKIISTKVRKKLKGLATIIQFYTLGKIINLTSTISAMHKSLYAVRVQQNEWLFTFRILNNN